ncbi:MAG: hypothetical protein JO129_00450 [Candidatus Dependentiae bacterium]|nr:hypothetical protein [Candidatus Dependentiae bacterium]
MKKQIFRILALISLFSFNSILFSEASVNNVEDSLEDTSGRERIDCIIKQIQHDIVPGMSEPISYIATSNLDKDLNIEEIANFFNCKTVMGNTFLKETLQRPVSPIDQSKIIDLRKNAIAQLVHNPNLKKQVEILLKIAAEQEKVVIELMSNTFKGQSCSELTVLKQLEEQKHPLYSWAKFNVYNPVIRTISFAELLSYTVLLSAATPIFGMAAIKEPDYTVPAVYSGLGLAVMGYALYKDCYDAGQKRVRMHALNQLIHISESIQNFSEEFKFETQFKLSLITNDADCAIIDGLKYSRYEDKTNYWFFVPVVHTFLYQVYEKESQLAQVFASIAEMDAYNAIATKILESQASEHKFCFATVIQSSKPQIKSKSFWNVLVPNAVVNSMDQDKHVILTGPNAGGKTTSIRAILQNIILAQTFGVAAAELFEYTQFDVILSYLNISDDLLNGLSLFASEIKRAKELVEIIKELAPDQKLFFVLDELFTGTAAEQGEKCAYEFIKKTAGYDQILFIYATHFNKLKELGNQDFGLMNYKVNAPTKNNAGKLVYPFTLSAGASDINIAEDMAREAGLFD